jgi:hypothetical protein
MELLRPHFSSFEKKNKKINPHEFLLSWIKICFKTISFYLIIWSFRILTIGVNCVRWEKNKIKIFKKKNIVWKLQMSVCTIEHGILKSWTTYLGKEKTDDILSDNSNLKYRSLIRRCHLPQKRLFSWLSVFSNFSPDINRVTCNSVSFQTINFLVPTSSCT